MKIFAIGFVASAAFIGATGIAFADGYERYAPRVVVPPCASFSGFYIGGNLGSVDYRPSLEDRDGLLSLNFPNQAATFSGSDTAFAGGAQVGYNLQRGCTLFGLEADWSWTDAKVRSQLFPNAVAVRDISTEGNLHSFGTLRTRSGVIVDHALLYVTGGLAWMDVRHNLHWNARADNEAFSFSDTRLGWTVGLGIEYALSNSISIKSEALYMATADDEHRVLTNPAFNLCSTAGSTCDFKTNEAAWVARVGLNFRFNGDRAVAVPLK